MIPITYLCNSKINKGVDFAVCKENAKDFTLSNMSHNEIQTEADPALLH